VATQVRVVGDAELAATLAAAAKALPTLDTTQAARIIAGRIPSTAPRRTGRLAGSFISGRDTITSPLVYAVPIHWGRPAHNIGRDPFVYPAAEHSEPQWSRALEDAGQKLCDGVHGA
jgi:hypothetical protein